MNIKIKFPLDRTTHNGARLSCLAMLFVIFTIQMAFLSIDFHRARQSTLSSSETNMNVIKYWSSCVVPYDECRCSIISNKLNESIKCISDLQAMSGHILPLVSYAWQLYYIYHLFSFTGEYSHFLADIFWLFALFIFVMTAVGVQGSSCLHFITSFVIGLTNLLLFLFIFRLIVRSNRQHSSRGRRNDHNDNINITIPAL